MRDPTPLGWWRELRERRREARAVLDEARRAVDSARMVRAEAASSSEKPGRPEGEGAEIVRLAFALQKAEAAFSQGAYFAARGKAMWVIARAVELLADPGAAAGNVLSPSRKEDP
jgi:hypothetical protein